MTNSAQHFAGELHLGAAVIPAGQAIGNYRILSKIGTGGMGVVYLAEHPLIGKRVALKVIHSDLAAHREVVQRFFQEAWAVNKIGDDHIVEIHDFGQTPEGDHFYIMEFLEGETLANAIASKSLDVIRALHIGAQIAKALAAAHAAGVMHRDLKPDNIMLTKRLGDSDFVKLLDFGLAKIFIGADASTVKTAAGILLGTPQYMSPEACETRGDVDHRTDIYALGVLLFQMLTGVVPFDGESVGEVLVKQVTQLPPPLRSYNPSIPPSVEQIVLRCLMKVPDKRFSSMLELRTALLDPEAYLRSGPPMAQARALRPGEAAAEAKTIAVQVAAADGADASFVAASGSSPHSPAPSSSPESAPVSSPVARTMVIPTPVGYVSHSSRRGLAALAVVMVLLVVGGGMVAARYVRANQAPVTAGAIAANRGTVLGVAPVPLPAVGDITPFASPAEGLPRHGVDADVIAVPSTADPSTADPAATDPAAAESTADVDSGDVGSAAGMQEAEESAVGVVLIDSMPRGAEVVGADRTVVGTTPTKLRLPIAAKTVTVNLRMPGYQTKTKQFVVTGNAVIAVPLEKLGAAKRRDHRGHRERVGSRGASTRERLPYRGADDLERP